eukprot:TRINITY_DN1679_c0_g2_i1.p1 TRINITY_DN1679_c0_g2~~TRINITY_DN1679_c0_g2_i1.p1  ORF type:complete len:191 (+),score=36.04 TRINITY_DN1679_c0_g2_i1:189-761(+)
MRRAVGSTAAKTILPSIKGGSPKCTFNSSTTRITSILASKYTFFRIWNAIPLKFFIFLCLFCLWTKEWYPFSHFPMYARLSNSTTILHLTDKNNQVIAMQRDFGVRSSMVKKYFETRAVKALKTLGREATAAEWKTIQEKCAEETLQSFYRTAKNKEKLEVLRPIKLWQARIVMQANGTIHRTETVIAEG